MYKLFRLRFRVSYQFFSKILEKVSYLSSFYICSFHAATSFTPCFCQLRERPDLFPETGGLTAADGSKIGECHPIELKLLVTLRVLARNCTFDDGSEATAISCDVLRKFFITFVDFYANEIGPNLIEVPRTAEAIEECLSGYATSGFPGFVGSVSIQLHVHINNDFFHKT